MSDTKRLVVLGIVGATLDSGKGAKRWEKWRPTVSLGQMEDLLPHRIELLVEPKFTALGRQVVEDLGAVAPDCTVQLHGTNFADPWDFEEVWRTLYEFARSHRFDPENEEYLLHITTGTHVQQICMFLLAESRHIPARLLQTSPITRRDRRERQDRRVGRYSIIDLDLSKYDSIAQRFDAERAEGVSLLKQGIPTRNAAFNRMMDQIERVALASTAPILLTGPTGAGKTRLAKRIYSLRSQRRTVTGDYVEVNCATLRGDAAMSALFGHTRGAFTGAVSDRAGLLKAADGGLVFLDEIGELGLDEQAMLLRAIEEGVFVPLGADREVRSDFQLIAGTNKDLVVAVGRGEFRSDLLARINLWTFRLPGLSERIEDLEPNLEFELESFARHQGRRIAFNAEARTRYLDFATGAEATWAGNFRDLNASVTRMGTLAPGARITADVVDEEVTRLRSDWRDVGDETGAPTSFGACRALVAEVLGDEVAQSVDRFELVQLADVFGVCRRSRTMSEAGRRLFAESRKARSKTNDADRIRKYLLKWGVTFAEVTTK
ncbi:MAG: RNA repair transcriptional activator RtcR [Deltaproteobacteria bacterium]|nr:RNA repair transcriptional activator RtcR [Deltaproteobacteria bacterium]